MTRWRKQIEYFAIEVGDVGRRIANPIGPVRRIVARMGLVEGTNRWRTVYRPAVTSPHRQDCAACARDTDRLVQLLDGALDVVVGLENGVAIEHELDVGVVVARLPLQRGGLANRIPAFDGDELDAGVRAECPCTVDGLVGTSVVNQNDLPRFERLVKQRSQRSNDVALFVERGNDDIGGGLAPVFGRCWHRLVRAAEQSHEAQQGTGTEDEIRSRGHRVFTCPPCVATAGPYEKPLPDNDLADSRPSFEPTSPSTNRQESCRKRIFSHELGRAASVSLRGLN